MFIVMFSMFTLGMSDVFAWHDIGKKTWVVSNNAYLCEQNLNDVMYELMSPCSEVRKAADTWSGVKNSDWTLTYTSDSKAPIHLMGQNPSDSKWAAEAIPYFRNGVIIGSDIKFSLNYGFTDVSNNNSNKKYYDLESVALHEFGHIQWVGHSLLNADSVMQEDLNPNTIRDTPEKHDIDILKKRYPS